SLPRGTRPHGEEVRRDERAALPSLPDEDPHRRHPLRPLHLRAELSAAGAHGPPARPVAARMPVSRLASPRVASIGVPDPTPSAAPCLAGNGVRRALARGERAMEPLGRLSFASGVSQSRIAPPPPRVAPARLPTAHRAPRAPPCP